MYSLYFDGYSIGNPGPARAGYVIYKDNQEIFSDSKYVGTQTNNIAQYSALIIGIKKVIELEIKEIDIYGHRIINQIKGLCKISPILNPLLEHVKELTKNIKINFYIRVKNLQILH